MSGCCVTGCKNRRFSGYKLYSIPRGNRPFQKNRRRLWLRAINRKDWTDGDVRNARVCGAHFISGEMSLDYQSPDFVPSVFSQTKRNHNLKVKMESSYLAKDREVTRRGRPVKLSEQEERSRSDKPADAQASTSNPAEATASQTMAKQLLQNNGNVIILKDIEALRRTLPEAVVLTNIAPADSGTDTASEEEPSAGGLSPEDLQDTYDHNYTRMERLSTVIAAPACNDTIHDNHRVALKKLKARLAKQEQEILYLKMDIQTKDDQIHLLGKELNAVTTDALTPESLNKSNVPGYFLYSTGFTYEQFNNLCEFFKLPNDHIAQQTQVPLTYRIQDSEIFNMPLRSQFLLTLMKLRQNAGHKDLAFRFCIPLQSASTLFDSWVDYMKERLGQLSVWSHRDVISQNMPADFKNDFPNTFAILDCTELAMERPSSLLESQTYSMSLKSLVACDPRGAVMYVSALYPGSTSDKAIFNRCNIRELLQGCIQCGHLNVGDGLMTDQGFQIEKELQEIGLKLNNTPFARLGHRHADLETTLTIAKHRVHVERAIAKIKQFKIVSDVIPMSCFANINEIWYVVCMLSNFQPHIKNE